MNHAKEYLDVMDQLVPLLREGRRFCVMPRALLDDWIAYFWNRGTISYVLNDDGSAVAVCLVKLFRHLGQFLEPFVHDPCGKFCMIELMVAHEPVAMANIFIELTDRFGPQQVFMWDRGERTEGGTPRIYSWHAFETLARRLTCGLTTKERIIWAAAKKHQTR
jgi:hypothetical protein